MKIITSKSLIETDEIIYADYTPTENQTYGPMPQRLVVTFRGKYVLTFVESEAEELWGAIKREFTHPLRQYPIYPTSPYVGSPWVAPIPDGTPVSDGPWTSPFTVTCGPTSTGTAPGIKPEFE